MLERLNSYKILKERWGTIEGIGIEKLELKGIKILSITA
jgi:hypothetical protein